MPVWVKFFGWTLVLLMFACLALVARELGVGTALSRIFAPTTTIVMMAPPAPPTPPTVVVVMAPAQPAALAAPQYIAVADPRIVADRDAWKQKAGFWARAWYALADEVADNCRRNPNLRACQHPGHAGAIAGKPYAP